MNDKKQAENIVPSVENVATPPEKDLISSEDVLAVVSGDQVALVEQMERAREAALSQKSNAQEIAAEKAKKECPISVLLNAELTLTAELI